MHDPITEKDLREAVEEIHALTKSREHLANLGLGRLLTHTPEARKVYESAKHQLAPPNSTTPYKDTRRRQP